MILIDRNDETLTVVSQSKLDKTDTVYNFTVDEFHTYHVGELGVWVHNTDSLIDELQSCWLLKEVQVNGKMLLHGLKDQIFQKKVLAFKRA